MGRPRSSRNCCASRPESGVDALFAKACQLAEGLFPHQVEGVAFLLGRRRAILADDMGLGKTRQAIVALKRGRAHGPVLVVCPASRQAQLGARDRVVEPRRGRHRRARRPTAGRRALGGRQLRPARPHRDALARVPWAGVVFDEAHYLKNHTSAPSGCRDFGAADGSRRREPVVYAAHRHAADQPAARPVPAAAARGHPLARASSPSRSATARPTDNGYGWVTDGATNLEELHVQLTA